MHPLLLAATLLAACTSAPPRQGPQSSLNAPPSAVELEAADYGLAPADGYQDQVQAEMQQVLKDPESARYRFAAPKQGWMPRYHFDVRVPGEPHKHGYQLGWLVDFGVNAKNSYGGYAGEKAYVAFFQNTSLRGILQCGKYEDIFGYPTWDRIR